MAYVSPNYPSKKAFREAVIAGKSHELYNPSGMFPVERNGRVSIEGPHYPAIHKWYADCDVVEGVVVKVR